MSTISRQSVDYSMFDDLLGPHDGPHKQIVTPASSRRPQNLPAEATAGDLADLWGMSTYKAQKAASGLPIEFSDSGRCDTRIATRLFIRNLLDQIAAGARGIDPDLKKARLKVQRETAKKLALKNAVTQRELVSVVTVENKWAEILRSVRAGLLAIPSRISGKLNLSAHDLVVLDREIRDALTELGGEK